MSLSHETNRAPRERHPSLRIPAEVFAEITYRAYLLRLEPPMTPEQSAVSSRIVEGKFGRDLLEDDASRRRNSQSMNALTRAYLRALVDMGMLDPEVPPAEGLLG